MFKKKYLGLAIAATLAAGSAHAALETSVTLKNETAWMVKDGIRTGEATSTTDTTGEGKGVYKFENTAKIFLNDALDNGVSWHGELNIVRDTKAIDDYKGHETNSQRDWLRELYVDTRLGEWDARIGKQQVVWGTADGIKLLDIINPTDYTEMNQNTMADARIPVWMINVEKYLDNGANVQAVVSEAEANKFAGLNDCKNDAGHPFITKGVDTICGQTNGFYNIAPEMGTLVTAFAQSGGLTGYEAYTVTQLYAGGMDAQVVGAATNLGLTTNLQDATTTLSNPDSMFEYMSNATAATIGAHAGITSEYRKDHDSKPNFSARYRNTTAGGTNYSFNYSNHYDANPVVSVHWEDASGNIGTPFYYDYTTYANNGTLANGTSVLIADSQGQMMTNQIMVFEEKLNRINSIGGSFDTVLEAAGSPVVVRGEFLYDKGVKTPVIDRSKLSYGDFAGALQNEEADFFKYVIGADVTVATDMMVSGQFIQLRNLDFVDTNLDSVAGSACTTSVNCGEYTANPATMHLSNGLQKARENQNFYSLFFSKPFGESGEGRWNNIFMYEAGGGKWNRFDVEYGFNDKLIGTLEYNKYFGDNDTMFGQFENASNVQVGIKYLLQ